MEALLLIGYSVIGAIFWVINVESLAILYGATRGWNPLLVGVLLATGQNITYVALYFGGDQLIHRWDWLGTRVKKVFDRFGDNLRQRFLGVTALAGLTGLPPAVAMPALAPGAGVKLISVISVTFTTRVIRFTILAWFGEAIYSWWNAL